MNKNTLLMLIVSFVFIFCYGRLIQYAYPNKNETCIDPMNKILVKVCGWNILHVIFFYAICNNLNVQNNLKNHILIFMFGIVWYNIETFVLLKTKNDPGEICTNQNDLVYDNLWKPHVDDIIFNILGQLLYIGFN